MTMIDETIEYDNFGRMKYHPEYHFSHGKRFSKEELMYLCRFWEFDNRKDVALALGKTEHTLATKVWELRRDNEFEYYKQEYDNL